MPVSEEPIAVGPHVMVVSTLYFTVERLMGLGFRVEGLVSIRTHKPRVRRRQMMYQDFHVFLQWTLMFSDCYD